MSTIATPISTLRVQLGSRSPIANSTHAAITAHLTLPSRMAAERCKLCEPGSTESPATAPPAKNITAAPFGWRISDSSRRRTSTPIGFDSVREALRIQVHQKSAGRAAREVGGTANLSVPTALGAKTLMITNPTPMCELPIGLAGVNQFPIMGSHSDEHVDQPL